MFYCNPCGNSNGWPVKTSLRSFGPCEICDEVAPCNDVPSRFLAAMAERTKKEREFADAPPFPYEILS